VQANAPPIRIVLERKTHREVLDGLPSRAKPVLLPGVNLRSFSMAYDEELATRIRARMDDPLGVSERAMFGGLAFLVYGNMCVGVIKRDLMVRVGAGAYEKALAEPFVRPMDFTGKPLQGFIYVDADGLETDAQLETWLDRGRAFVSTLPPKDATKKSVVKKSANKARAPGKSTRKAKP
jgi:TfoX/Sxy family transcriptional regulator of competence genes